LLQGDEGKQQEPGHDLGPPARQIAVEGDVLQAYVEELRRDQPVRGQLTVRAAAEAEAPVALSGVSAINASGSSFWRIMAGFAP
jgi:hypothetical protein